MANGSGLLLTNFYLYVNPFPLFFILPHDPWLETSHLASLTNSCIFLNFTFFLPIFSLAFLSSYILPEHLYSFTCACIFINILFIYYFVYVYYIYLIFNIVFMYKHMGYLRWNMTAFYICNFWSIILMMLVI